jgi:putative molybdopterin biosynthesis protein
MAAEIRNQLRTVRTRLGLSQQDLARAAGVARQTIGGIEAGTYSVSLSVALRLAKALGCSVEEVFALDTGPQTLSALPAADLAASGAGGAVSVVRVGGRWVAHPCAGDRAFRIEMVPADGTIAGREPDGAVMVRLLDDVEALERTVLLAGCTPALSLWARSAERWYPGLRVPWVHANSTAALAALARGEVHAAGIHVHDPESRNGNVAFVRRALPGVAVTLVTLGDWDEGFVVAPGNPKGIRCGADLARSEVTLVNREPGAGARLLLDGLLRQEGVPAEAVAGYEQSVAGHIEVARAVVAGRADVGVSAAAVAAAFGLGFVPLGRVRCDVALLADVLETEPVRQLLMTLEHRRVRAQFAALGGYDTSATGETVTVGPAA